MSFEEIFNPGIRFWKEFQDEQETKRAEAPAPGPGPVTVDLDQGVITIEQPTESGPGYLPYSPEPDRPAGDLR